MSILCITMQQESEKEKAEEEKAEEEKAEGKAEEFLEIINEPNSILQALN